MRVLVVAVAILASACVMQSNPQAEQSLAAQVPGRYLAQVDGQAVEVVLNPDGTGTANGQPGQWTISMGQLMLSDGQQWAPASLEGGVLTVQTPDGAVAFYRQDAGGPVVGGPAPVAAVPGEAPSQPVAAPVGDIDTRLVGCWEDYSSHAGGTGSGSFQRIVTLGADGRFSVRTFSSVSAGDLSSVSDDTEEGTWRASGDTISVIPQTGEQRTLGFQLDGGLLYLEGTKLVPCS